MQRVFLEQAGLAGFFDALVFSDEERHKIAHGADEIDLVNSGLEETMVTAYRQIREQWTRDARVADLRTAAFLTALHKVAATYLELGIFP